MLYKGSCHCSAVKFEVETDLKTIKQCNCSICVRKFAKMNLVHRNDFKITKGSENLSKYEFGTNQAKHFFCKTCGIYTHHIRRSDPNGIGLNTGCLENLNPFELNSETLNNK